MGKGWNRRKARSVYTVVMLLDMSLQSSLGVPVEQHCCAAEVIRLPLMSLGA